MSGKSDARTVRTPKHFVRNHLECVPFLRQLEECGASSPRFRYSLRSEIGS